MLEDALLLAIYLIPLILILAVYFIRQQRNNRASLALIQVAKESGLIEPASLHPRIDSSQCIGCGACVKACPEHNVLGLLNGKVELVSPANCIGHGACQKACPVNAIDLVFGTATRGIDIPLIGADFQTSVAGIYIAGELGGMGLIRNAIEQGRQAMDNILSLRSKERSLDWDVVIIGAGPAGLSASLAAKAAGAKAITLDQEHSLGGTVAHFPRGKLVMTQPATLPLVGKISLTETSKEHLLSLWNGIIKKHPLELQFGEQAHRIEPIENGFIVHTQNNTYRCHHVLLTIGRRGTPRKLDIPGEEKNKVVYRLIDPAQYQGQAVMVIGGGDSALEAAISIAEETETTVTLVYRGDGFNRAKAKNRQHIEALLQEKKITVLLNSEPATIENDVVLVKTPQGICAIKNDSVIVCAGGVLPTGFLKDIGIGIETKYGTA